MLVSAHVGSKFCEVWFYLHTSSSFRRTEECRNCGNDKYTYTEENVYYFIINWSADGIQLINTVKAPKNVKMKKKNRGR